MYEYKLKRIIKIYDGDTITVELDLGFGVSKIEKIRLSDIDTPEIRGEEREEGLISRSFVVEKLTNAEDIVIKTFKDRKGKYGRYIGEVFVDGLSLNKELLQLGLAEEYKK